MTTGRVDAVFGDGATVQPRAQRELASLAGQVAAQLRKPQSGAADSGNFRRPAEPTETTERIESKAVIPPQEVGSRVDLHQPEFDAFFLRYEQALYGYLRRMLPSEEIALELAQETFFRAWQHFAELQTYDRPESWLYRVATNLAISYLRRKRPLSFSQVFKRSHNEGEVNDTPMDYEFLADPFDMEQQTADKDAIEQVLQKLSERQRAALLLRVVYGLSCEEIGETLGISVPNVRQTLSRGRERFRKLYGAKRK